MRHTFGGVLILCMAGIQAAAFGPTTHAYIAMLATDSNNSDVIFGAIVPDCTQILGVENAAEASALNHMTHFEPERLAASCFALGFSTHNGTWGADHYAHLVFTADPEEIYSVVKIRQLSTEFGISLGNGEDLFEMALDYLIRVDYGPEIGVLLARSAEASGTANEQALVDAYAAELSARVAGLSLEEAQEDIRHAHAAYRELIKVLGLQMQQSPEPVKAILMPLLAGYLGTDVQTATTYFERAVEICADYKPEMERIASNIRPQLAALECFSAEGEGEPEGEEPYTVDFCDAFSKVSANPLLSQVGGQFMELIALINPQTADLNGSYLVDVSDMQHPVVDVNGNGLTDAPNELALLAKILATPGFNNGVLTHESVHAAWQHNWNQLLEGNIGSIFAPVLVPMAPGLLEILTGYVTIGDGTLASSSFYAASGSGSFGFVAGMFSVLNDAIVDKFGSGLAQPQLNPEDFVRLGALWPEADADGDGYSNRSEYAYFTPLTCPGAGKSSSAIDYVNAALTASICPDCAECPDCAPTTDTLFRVGRSACLSVPGNMPPETAFQWSKNGLGPLADGRYVGVHCQKLSIPYLQIEDSGTYTCAYGSEKAIYSVTIQVAEKVPLAGFAGLAAATGVMALCGGFRIRRRGKRG